MHPILARGSRLAVYLALFAAAGVVLAELLARVAAASRVQAVLLVLPPLLVHAFSCLASWYLCKRQPLDDAAVVPLLVSQLSAGLTTSALLVALVLGWARLLSAGGAASVDPARIADSLPLLASFAFLLYALSAAVHYLLIIAEQRRRAEARAYELRLLAREAELRALKAQVDPHFLFNSLNSIGALVTSDPQQARRMCIELASFLRQSLRLGGAEMIRLADEIALARSYLSVEQIRFGDRLKVDCRLAADCADCRVPPLLLQPLIENAVKHGIARSLKGGTVHIDARRERGELRITIDNPRDEQAPPRASGGIGLANVRQRLERSFGRSASLEIEAPPQGFRVVLRLPRLREATAAATSG